MCTYNTEKVEIAGSGKGAQGWFQLTDATVYFDHPVHAMGSPNRRRDSEGRNRADRENGGVGPTGNAQKQNNGTHGCRTCREGEPGLSHEDSAGAPAP